MNGFRWNMISGANEQKGEFKEIENYNVGLGLGMIDLIYLVVFYEAEEE